MAAAVITRTTPTDVNDTIFSNKDVKFIDITADTGDYAAGGFTLTAAQLGVKHVDICIADGVATQGTDGASAVGVGITYLSSGTSVKFQLYEAAADNSPLEEKGAEAYAANFTFRVLVIGQ